MRRLLLGSLLLLATLVTGILAGTTGETRGRALVVVRTIEAPPDASIQRDAPRVEVVASVQARKEEPPEASDLVERMRRLVRVSDWEAQKIKEFHRDYKQRLKQRAFAVTDTLLADPATQRLAVETLRALRRERREFMRQLLGRERWAEWKRIESTGGRDVARFLQLVREREDKEENR